MYQRKGGNHTQSLKLYLRENALELVVGGVLLLLVVSQLVYFWERVYFGHDDLSQIESYVWFFETEGRWMIYFMFPFMRYVNTHLALMADLFLFGIFSYICARQWLNAKRSLVVVLLLLLTPSIAFFVDWPIIGLPAFVFLAAAALSSRVMPRWAYFCLFGVLFNATYSNMYFLLPLLFLNERPSKQVLGLIWWVMGYLVGFAVAEVITYTVCGHFIELAEFRQPHYIRNWGDVVVNAKKALTYLNEHVRYLGNVGALVLAVSAATYCWKFRKYVWKGGLPWLVLAGVALSCYAQSIPAGIAVSLRTVHGLYIAVILGVIMSLRHNRVLLSVAVLVLGCRCFCMNATNLKCQNAIKAGLYSDIAQLNINPSSVKGVVMLSTDDDIKQIVELMKQRCRESCYPDINLNLDSWCAAPRRAGFENIAVRQWAIDCIRKNKIDLSEVRFIRQGIYNYAVYDEWLLLKINDFSSASF